MAQPRRSQRLQYCQKQKQHTSSVRSATPNAEGEPLPDSTQTRCLDKKEGTETFSCEGSYSEIGEECGQTFEADKKDLQKEIKNEREFCRESEDATCEKRKN